MDEKKEVDAIGFVGPVVLVCHSLVLVCHWFCCACGFVAQLALVCNWF